ncbi:MAG: hypothetical protein U1E21_05880 [Reyranellaceae bacterium]
MSRVGTLTAIGLFFAALSVPLVTGVIVANGPIVLGLGENRMLADAPALPANGAQLQVFPSRVDAYVNDHFPFRAQLVEVNNRLRFHLFREVMSPQITIGSDDYLFFNSHSAADPLSMIRFLCGEGSDAARIDKIARDLSDAVARLTAQLPASTLMVVPTKSTIYFEHMPAWLQQRCRRSIPAVPRVLARLADLSPSNRQHVYYPIEAMRALRATVAVYPPQNFHWLGPGARAVAEETASKVFGRTRRKRLDVRPVAARSDLQQFLPGITISVTSEVVDFNSVGITACQGSTCFPELGDAARVLGDVGRFEHATSSGPKLLILSDSFGAGIAGYFAPYFSSVWHVSVNDVSRLSPAQLNKVRAALYDDFAPNQILYIFHDFSIQYFDNFLKPLH